MLLANWLILVPIKSKHVTSLAIGMEDFSLIWPRYKTTSTLQILSLHKLDGNLTSVLYSKLILTPTKVFKWTAIMLYGQTRILLWLFNNQCQLRFGLMEMSSRTTPQTICSRLHRLLHGLIGGLCLSISMLILPKEQDQISILLLLQHLTLMSL